jgi:hypothetical protein
LDKLRAADGVADERPRRRADVGFWGLSGNLVPDHATTVLTRNRQRRDQNPAVRQSCPLAVLVFAMTMPARKGPIVGRCGPCRSSQNCVVSRHAACSRCSACSRMARFWVPRNVSRAVNFYIPQTGGGGGECLRCAEQCRKRRLPRDGGALAALSRSYEFTERLSRFTKSP